VTCFDDAGAEAWGVDLPGVVDVVEGRNGWLVQLEQGSRLLSLEGRTVARLDHADLAALSRSGRVAWTSEDLVGWMGEPGVPLPDNVVPIEVLAANDGRVGVLDESGVLYWMSSTGEPLGEVDLEVSAGGPVRAVSLSTGWAVLDDDGVQILDEAGQVRHELDVLASDAAVVDGGLWLATDEGVLDVDLSDGSIEVEQDVALESLAASADGELLIGLMEHSSRLYVDDETRVGAVGHTSPVVRLAPRRDGGLASVDADGHVIVWTSAGVAKRLPVLAEDAAWDLDGGLWLATGERLIRWTDKTVVELEFAAHSVAGDGQRIVATGTDQVWSVHPVSGELSWTKRWAVAGRPVLASDVVLFPQPDGAWRLLDGKNGASRRRLAPVGVHLGAAALSVEGLVLYGNELGSDGSRLGWRPGVAADWSASEVSGQLDPAVAPNGRWAAWHDDHFVTVANAQGEVRHSGKVKSSSISAVVSSERYVWVGRMDGRVERWHVQSVVDDLRPPRFNGYAQLDAPLIAARKVVAQGVSRDGGVAILADDASVVALAYSSMLTLEPESLRASVVVLADPAPSLTAVAWQGDLGLIVGAEDGRLWRVGSRGRAVALASVPGSIAGLCFIDNTVYVGSSDGVWRVSARQPKAVAVRVSDDPQAVGAVACHPDGEYVAVERGGRVQILNPSSGAVRATLEQGAAIRSISISPTADVLATGGDDEVVVLWQPDTWTPSLVLEGHGSPVVGLGWGGEEQRLLAITSAGAVLWDVLSGAPVAQVDGVDELLLLHPDGDRALWLGKAPTWIDLSDSAVSPMLQTSPGAGAVVP
jgi:WD40 repeat protein